MVKVCNSTHAHNLWITNR